jgi:hypothetical protein
MEKVLFIDFEVVTTQSVTTMEGTFEHTSELLYL